MLEHARLHGAKGGINVSQVRRLETLLADK